VKLLRAVKGRFVFQMVKREQKLLLQTLKLYPLVPSAHQRLSQSARGEAAEENQRLLEESLAERRRENRRQVEAMLKEPARFRQTSSGLQLSLASSEMEWLLQVLNDIRVGSWLAAGEPGEGNEPEITPDNARHFIAMEVSGFFQSVLLAALGMEQSADWR